MGKQFKTANRKLPKCLVLGNKLLKQTWDSSDWEIRLPLVCTLIITHLNLLYYVTGFVDFDLRFMGKLLLRG